MQNFLCISIDGLQSGMIGAFGNTWIHTPTLDSLACQSALFHRYYTSSLNSAQILNKLWQLPQGYRTILITDDKDVFQHEKALAFDAKYPLKTKQHDHPASRFEKTNLFRHMAATTNLLKRPFDKPFFLWAHFNVFRKHWDFPLSYRKQYQIDEDPDPYADVALPNIADANIDPDIRQSIIEAYAGGVSMLDEALSGLLAFLKAEKLDQNTVLAFLSLRGFSLGEHNRIGNNTTLYSENTHLPLMIRYPGGTFSGFRSQTLLQPSNVVELLQMQELPEEPHDIHSMIKIEDVNSDEKALVTPDWFLYRKSSGDELYVKPDDQYEVNDVADRCPHVLEQFLGDEFNYNRNR